MTKNDQKSSKINRNPALSLSLLNGENKIFGGDGKKSKTRYFLEKCNFLLECN